MTNTVMKIISKHINQYQPEKSCVFIVDLSDPIEIVLINPGELNNAQLRMLKGKYCFVKYTPPDDCELEFVFVKAGMKCEIHNQ